MKAKTKADKAKKPQIKLQDMKPKKDAKAGGLVMEDRYSRP